MNSSFTAVYVRLEADLHRLARTGQLWTGVYVAGFYSVIGHHGQGGAHGFGFRHPLGSYGPKSRGAGYDAFW